VWSVELPNRQEREAIWSIHIAKRKRNPINYDLTALSKETEGFSGRQIEQAWVAAMTAAFNDGGREPTTDDCVDEADKMTPTSETMALAIEARRKRLAGCASPASSSEVKSVVKMGRKIG
jgi:SpoVK/Ycf46/Vps4 family AAA+-type ATPase